MDKYIKLDDPLSKLCRMIEYVKEYGAENFNALNVLLQVSDTLIAITPADVIERGKVDGDIDGALSELDSVNAKGGFREYADYSYLHDVISTIGMPGEGR